MRMKPLRAVKALVSVAKLVRDPSQLGEVFAIADAVQDPAALDEIVDRLSGDPKLAVSFVRRHRFKVDLAALKELPTGTLGRVFADHMIAAGLDPSALPQLASPDARSFFRAHMYETHDIWHAVTGFGTDVFGEIGLQAFYLAQIRGGLPPLLLAVGFARVALFDRTASTNLMNHVELGWRMGKAAKPLFGTHWDELWTTPIAEVRRQFGLDGGEVAALGVTALAA